MSKFSKAHLINVFSQLGLQLRHPDEQLVTKINSEKHYNAWFTPANVEHATKAIGVMLNKDDLTRWLNRYQFDESGIIKNIGLILAGNIPLVGFHDVLCVLVSGNMALIKASSQDTRMIKAVLDMLCEIEPSFCHQFRFVEKLENFDAVIATGSNNTSRYFEYYFGRVPHIIRKNRSSIAFLTGNETKEQLHRLGEDIFSYFGLGCRNVSKMLVPAGYDFGHFFRAIETYQPAINHHKYSNNYDYNKSVFLVNGDQHLDNGFLLLREEQKLASPLAVVYYEYYDNRESAEQKLDEISDNIQCIVSAVPLDVKNQVVDFGQSQQPQLWDYADNVDTMNFLAAL